MDQKMNFEMESGLPDSISMRQSENPVICRRSHQNAFDSIVRNLESGSTVTVSAAMG
jgi:hypothetical protein